MASKLGSGTLGSRPPLSGTKDTLGLLQTALEGLFAARIHLRSAGANYTLIQLARTIRNLEEEIRDAQRRIGTELRLEPGREHASKTAKAQWKKAGA